MITYDNYVKQYFLNAGPLHYDIRQAANFGQPKRDLFLKTYNKK